MVLQISAEILIPRLTSELEVNLEPSCLSAFIQLLRSLVVL